MRYHGRKIFIGAQRGLRRHMFSYYTVIVAVSVAISLIMCAVTRDTPVFDKRQKRQFLFLYLSVGIASLCEWGGVALDGAGETARSCIPMLKLVEFSLTPTLGVTFASILEGPDCRRIKIAMRLLLANAALELALVPFGLVFYIDANGFYRHGPLYAIYMVAYSASMLFLLVETRRYADEIQFRGRRLPWLFLAFLIVSLVAQSVADVRVIWLSIAVGSLFFYNFYSSVVMQIDPLTNLLNRSSYGGTVSMLDEEALFLQIDVDCFKAINDTYGHAAGDRVLRQVGRTMFEVYGRYGDCFRTGGDEFCVVLTDELDRAEALNAEFRRRLSGQRVDDLPLPGVSIGGARYVPGAMSREDAVHEADERMYEDKRRRKQDTASRGC